MCETIPSSLLATICLKQLAIENNSYFPTTSKVVSRDFFTNDLLTAAKDETFVTNLKHKS